MGNSPGLVCGGSPGWRSVLLRSSSHSAHGQASRRKGNGYREKCLSFHSISTPVPAVKCTLTDLGSAKGMDSVSQKPSLVVIGDADIQSPEAFLRQRGDMFPVTANRNSANERSAISANTASAIA